MSDRRLRSSKGKAVKRKSGDDFKSEEKGGKEKKQKKRKTINGKNQISNKTQPLSSRPTSTWTVERTRLFGDNHLQWCVEYNGVVKGLTVVDGHLFVILSGEKYIMVTDSNTITEYPQISIPQMIHPEGLAGCSRNKALYVIDKFLKCVFRIDLNNKNVTRWNIYLNGTYVPMGVSVTSDHNVIVTEHSISLFENPSVIVEYTKEGYLIRKINLDKSVNIAWQAIKLSNDQFLFCHGDGLSKSYCRICSTNSKGEIIKSFGKEKGSGKNQLNSPCSITVDNKRGIIFVSDQSNHRVLKFKKDLTLIGQVETYDETLSFPSSVFFEPISDRLFIVDRFDRVLIMSATDK